MPKSVFLLENSQENSNINDPPSANTRNNETVESPSPENDSSVFERYIPPGAPISKTRRSNRLIASSIKKKIGLNEAEGCYFYFKSLLSRLKEFSLQCISFFFFKFLK